MAFITSGPIYLSGQGDNSVYSFITGAGGTVSTLSLSGLYSAASGAGITLSGSASYSIPYLASDFYGMATSSCCLLWEDDTCVALEGGGNLDLEGDTCSGLSCCVLAEDGTCIEGEAGGTVELETCT